MEVTIQPIGVLLGLAVAGIFSGIGLALGSLFVSIWLEPHVKKWKKLRLKAKQNQKAGGGSGSSGRQKSDKPTDVKKELAKTAGVSHDTIMKVKKIQEGK